MRKTTEPVRLSSLPCGAAIMAAGVLPVAAERGPDGHLAFVFPPEAAPLAAKFLTGALLVDAQDVFRRFDQLRDIVRGRYGIEGLVPR